MRVTPASLRRSGGELLEVVIGLEVHAQLLTRTKLFSSSPTPISGPPAPANTHVSAFDAAVPGSLPRVNRAALRLALRLGSSLGSTVPAVSRFERKHYTYRDLPHGFQITQQREPVLRGGSVTLLPREDGAASSSSERSSAAKGPAASGQRGEDEAEDLALADGDGLRGGARFALSPSAAVGIERVQLEIDTGKSLAAGGGGASAGALVDLNRAGCALVEVVTAPCVGRPSDAARFLRTLRLALRSAGVSDGNLEDGSLRCDANISVRLAGDPALGPRSEVKNLNSPRHVARACATEALRQARRLLAAIDADGAKQSRSPPSQLAFAQETRGFDPATGKTYLLRVKDAHDDYRFTPEPDVPALVPAAEELREARDLAAEHPAPWDEAARIEAEHPGIGPRGAYTLVARSGAVRYFEDAVAEARRRGCAAPDVGRRVHAWVTNEVFGRLASVAADPHPASAAASAKAGDSAAASPFLSVDDVSGGSLDCPVCAQEIGAIVAMVEGKAITGRSAKIILDALFDDPTLSAEAIVERDGLAAVAMDDADLDLLCRDAIRANPAQVEKFRSGNRRMVGFFVGAIMKATEGKADPREVSKVVVRILGEA